MNELLVLNLAILLGFFVQTTIGFASALVSLPLILTYYKLPEATGVLSIFLILFSAILIPQNWKELDKKLILKLSISTIIGLIVGIKILQYGDLTLLRKLFGAFLLVYVILLSIIESRKIQKPKNPGSSTIFGFLGGLFSGLFSSGGPVFVIYMKRHFKDAKKLRANIIGVLGITNFFRIPTLIQSKIINMQTFSTSLKLIPGFLIGLALGHFLLKKINKNILYKLILAGLFITGLSILTN